MDPTDPRDGALSPGTRVGPYDVTGRIGGGGMGEVYRAHDARFGRDVAIKVLPPSFASDPERLRRFEQEARAAGTIDHPGILVVHDFGSHEGRPYLATELLEGESLRERLASGSLPVRKAVDLAVQIARALAAAHDKGIVHRDLKPDNVFLTRDGRAKILDFGLAKLASVSPTDLDRESETLASPQAPGTSPGVLLGTVGYLSPEQARGRPADARSDIFSLGLVLYEMLTGTRAFARDSAVETLNAILKEDAPEMKTASGPAPTTVDRLVRRCLEKDPAERFQTARDLAFALEALGSGSEGRGLLLPETPVRRRWTVPALARGLGLLALGGLLTAGAGWLLRPLPPPRITGSRPLLNGFPGQPNVWVTDGERVYFSVFRDGRYQSFQVSLAGGEPAPITLPTKHAIVTGVSKKRSALLAIGWDGSFSDWSFRDLPLWIVPLPAGSPTRLGVNGSWATWSPDGETIAYTGGTDNSYLKPGSLFVARLDGSGSRQVWASPDADVQRATWSPDGGRLLVSYLDLGKNETWFAEVPSDGRGPARPLARAYRADWTPDGRYLVGTVGGASTGAPSPAERRRVNLLAWRRRAFGDLGHQPAPYPLTFGPMSFFGPVLTPDGQKIVAGGSLARSEPLRFNRATGEFERLPGGITGGFIDYSRDGQWVAWVDMTDRTLWRARRDGSDRLQLTLPPLEAGLVRWSPDASRLAFVGGRSADAPDVVYLVQRDGGAPEALSKPDPATVWDPCWMPDGRTLVWGNLDSTRGSVRTLDMHTRRVSVIPGSEHLMGPKCSPQGPILAYKNWSEGWWLYRPDSQRWNEFIPAGAQPIMGYPTWSRDGRWIYGLSQDQRAVLRLRIEDPRPETVATLGSIDPTAPSLTDWWMSLDPDDAPVVLRDTSMWDLYVLDWEAP